MLPMSLRISNADLDEFIAIYKEEFGEEISHADAHEIASRLVMLYAHPTVSVRDTDQTIAEVSRLDVAMEAACGY